MRQLLTESLILSLDRGRLGLIVGTMGIRALLALNSGNIPRIGQDGMAIPLDWRVLGFTLLSSLVTGMLFGSVPALHAARPDLNTALKEGGSRCVGGRQNRTRSLMVIAEMALAIRSTGSNRTVWRPGACDIQRSGLYNDFPICDRNELSP